MMKYDFYDFFSALNGKKEKLKGQERSLKGKKEKLKGKKEKLKGKKFEKLWIRDALILF